MTIIGGWCQSIRPQLNKLFFLLRYVEQAKLELQEKHIKERREKFS